MNKNCTYTPIHKKPHIPIMGGKGLRALKAQKKSINQKQQQEYDESSTPSVINDCKSLI